MAERELIGLVGLGGLFLLLMLRVPVGLAMILTGISGNYALSLVVPFLRFEPYIKQFKTLFWSTMANYDLSVVPLFILMGYLASYANLSRDLFQGLNALIGRARGGIAIAVIGACAGLGAVCGSSLATASTMGRVALPEFKRMKYDTKLATGTLAAGGTLGILIPPSIALIIYAIIVEASIIQMFQAAIIPGLIAVAFFIIVVVIFVRIKPDAAPICEAMERAVRQRAIRRLLPIFAIFGSIIFGLAIGLFTPTPAAAVGVCAVLVYGLFLRRRRDGGLSNDGIKKSLLDTASTAGMIYFILFGAEVLKSFFARSGLPITLAQWATTSELEPWTILIIMLFSLILLGCFMESLSMLLVAVPFFWPVLVELNGGEYITASAAAYGLDTASLKVWFGILALIVVELGLITPPVGLNILIIHSISKDISMKEIFYGVMPFVGSEIIRIILLLTFPFLTLIIPNLLRG